MSLKFLKSQYGLTDEMLPSFLFMRGTEPTDQLAAYQPMVYKITTNGLEAPTSSIEYLDLSQASGLTRIASGAFASSSTTQSLKYLNLDGVDPTVIEEAAFNYSNLQNLTIDTDFNDFQNNMVIDTLRILPSETTTEITGVTGSSYKKTVNNLIIGDGITKIGDNAFNGAPAWDIANVELPDTLVEIGNSAFSNNSSLTSIHFPKNLKKIGNMAFMYTSLTNVTLSDDYKLDYIGSRAFCNIPLEEFNSVDLNGNDLELIKTKKEALLTAAQGVATKAYQKAQGQRHCCQ